MNTIRDLLGEITGLPTLVGRLGEHDDLQASGIGSGDIIRLVALLEDRHGIEISADELDLLTSVSAFQALVDGRSRQDGTRQDGTREAACG